jgi:hypothetical protein
MLDAILVHAAEDARHAVRFVHAGSGEAGQEQVVHLEALLGIKGQGRDLDAAVLVLPACNT